jgi:Kef-type K+ transport system membrane component KefB
MPLQRIRALVLVVVLFLPRAGYAAGSGEGSHSLISNIAVAIAAAAGVGLAMKLLRQPVIFGQLSAGFVIGPVGLKLITDQSQIVTMGEIGLILLLFMIGLEINLHKMLSAGRLVMVPGLVQFPLCAGLGFGLFSLLETAGMDLGGTYARAYLAIAVALSSTMIVVKLLYEKAELDTLAGRVTVGILIFQDLWAIIILAIQPGLADFHPGGILRTFLAGAALVAVALAASKHILPRLFRRVAKVPELLLVISLGWCFLVALVAARPAVGLSMEMGALIAGVSLATFPYNADVIARVVSLRDFFVTLFFVALGMQIPWPDGSVLAAAGAVAAVALLLRVPGLLLPLLALGAGHRVALLTSINLSQVSEFSLVIVALGAGFGHIGEGTVATVIWIFALMAVLSTYLIQNSHPLQAAGGRLLRGAGVGDIVDGGESARARRGHPVVVLGFHRTADALLSELAAQNPEARARVKVVDFNPLVRERLEAMGVDCVYGDISHIETLKQAGLEEGKVFICTLPDPILKGTTNLGLLKSLRGLFPGRIVVVTAKGPSQAAELYAAGADFVIQPSALAGAEAARAVALALDGALASHREEALARLASRAEIVPEE